MFGGLLRRPSFFRAGRVRRLLGMRWRRRRRRRPLLIVQQFQSALTELRLREAELAETAEKIHQLQSQVILGVGGPHTEALTATAHPRMAMQPALRDFSLEH